MIESQIKISPKKLEKGAKRNDKESLGDPIQYNDIYVRAYFGDTGVVPRTGGTLCASPDIIPYQTEVVNDPYKTFITDNWSNDIGKDINANQVNNIYMRGQNLSTAGKEGQMYLYYSQASLLLWPQDPLDPNKGWKHNGIKTASGANFSPIKAMNGGDKVVTLDPFCWVPDAPPSGDHYCLVGRVVTAENPNPIPDDLTTMDGFAGYISQHANMCWRNVTTIAPTTPVSTTNVRYDQGDAGGSVNMLIRCTNAPVGSQVSFNCASPGPKPLIDLPKTTVTNADTFTAGGTFDIPANFSSYISYSYYSNGLYPTKPMKIEIYPVYTVGAEHRLHRYASPLEDLGFTPEMIEEVNKKHKLKGSIGPVKGIVLGSHAMTTDTPQQASNTSGTRNETTSAAYIQTRNVEWLEGQSSLFGTSYVAKSVSIAPNSASMAVSAEVISLQDAVAAATDETARITADFNTGTYSGTFLFQVKTLNLPVGCEVGFTGGTKEYPINLARTKVTTSPTFNAGIMLDNVPANLLSTIDISFWKNGLKLTADSSIEFQAVHLETATARSIKQQLKQGIALTKISNGKGPIPGKVIGSVKMNLNC